MKKIALPEELVASMERRRFLKKSMTLGALTLLTGCNVTDSEAVHRALMAFSRWNDKVQSLLFDPEKLAPVYPESAVAHPFPFNAYYEEDEIPLVDAEEYRLELYGSIRNTRPWRLSELYALEQQSQITRLVCVEGWSAVGKWTGIPFRHFLERIGADLSAKYVGFKCLDDYHTSIDMASALHPQTLLSLGFGGRILTPEYGFPLRLRIPTKLGFKNPKHIAAIFVTNRYPGGYWEDQGYNWFSGS